MTGEDITARLSDYARALQAHLDRVDIQERRLQEAKNELNDLRARYSEEDVLLKTLCRLTSRYSEHNGQLTLVQPEPEPEPERRTYVSWSKKTRPQRPREGNDELERFYRGNAYVQFAKRESFGTVQRFSDGKRHNREGVWLTDTEAALAASYTEDLKRKARTKRGE